MARLALVFLVACCAFYFAVGAPFDSSDDTKLEDPLKKIEAFLSATFTKENMEKFQNAMKEVGEKLAKDGKELQEKAAKHLEEFNKKE